MDFLSAKQQQYDDSGPLKTGLSKTWLKINSIWSKLRKNGMTWASIMFLISLSYLKSPYNCIVVITLFNSFMPPYSF